MFKMNYMSLLLIGLLVVSVSCIPKYDDGNFKPSSHDNSEKMGKALDRKAVSSQKKSRNDNDLIKSASELNDRSQEPRFDYGHLSDSTVYGVGSHMPVGTDLGGLLLGAVIGIGTILIIPKLLYVFSGSHVGSHFGSHLGTHTAYARSDEQGGMMQLMSRVDDALSSHGIDTTACMQRLACAYAKQAAEASSRDEASNLERIVDAASISRLLRGTAVDDALETGRSGGNCAQAFYQCSLSPNIALPALAKLIAGTA